MELFYNLEIVNTLNVSGSTKATIRRRGKNTGKTSVKKHINKYGCFKQ